MGMSEAERMKELPARAGGLLTCLLPLVWELVIAWRKGMRCNDGSTREEKQYFLNVESRTSDGRQQ